MRKALECLIISEVCACGGADGGELGCACGSVKSAVSGAKAEGGVGGAAAGTESRFIAALSDNESITGCVAC